MIRLLSLILFGILMFAPNQVLATEVPRLFKGTCAKEVGFLRIESLNFEDSRIIKTLDVLKEKHGLFEITTGFECELEAGVFKFEIVDIDIDKFEDSTAFKTIDLRLAVLTLNKKIMFYFDVDQDYNHVFEVAYKNATHCIYDGKGYSKCHPLRSYHPSLGYTIEVELEVEK